MVKIILQNQKEVRNMATRNNRKLIPEAKKGLDQFKMETARELNVPLTDGYNGDLTSRQNGSVGGEMVKKMVEQYERGISTK